MSGNIERDRLEESIQRLEELKREASENWERKRLLEDQIVVMKRARLILSKFLSRFQWVLKVTRRRYGDRIFIEMLEEETDNAAQELEFFFGHWGASEGLYIFPDGETMKFYYNADDALFTIDIEIGQRPIEEYLTAFEELGIEISFENIDGYVDELRARAAEIERLVNMLR